VARVRPKNPEPLIEISGTIALTRETAIEIHGILGAKYGDDGPELFAPLNTALAEAGVSTAELDAAYSRYLDSRKDD
jgi:hypothetical protein